MIDSTRQFRKINSTCSQRISCVWWSEGKALSPVFGLSSHLSWPLKFLYWCWVINSHQRAILVLILSSWALSRAKPRLRHGPGILAWGDWDLKMQGCLWVSPPFPFYDPSEWNLIMASYIGHFYAPRKQCLFRLLRLNPSYPNKVEFCWIKMPQPIQSFIFWENEQIHCSRQATYDDALYQIFTFSELSLVIWTHSSLLTDAFLLVPSWHQLWPSNPSLDGAPL